ncbi:MAG: peptidylprolyl isomerase [Acidimicrobiales bacterium]
MKRLTTTLAGLAALCVLVLGLSGCDVHLSPYAAIVNGSEISQTQLRNALAAVVGNPSYKCAIESSGTTHVTGSGQGTYNSAFGAEVLSILIQDQVLRQHVARIGLSEPSGLYAAALSQLETVTAPPSTCPGSGASLMAAFPPWYRQVLVRFQMDEDALAAQAAGTSLSPAALDRYVAAHHNAMTAACVSVIEVGTKATALSLRAKLLGGASFAAVAKADSIDSTTAPDGGSIGCVPDSMFTSPLSTDLAALSVGRVSEPISFSSDWLLLLVTQRQAESYQDLVSSLVAFEQSALNKTFPRLIRSARIQIDPQFGTWDTKASLARVDANAAPPADIVPNPGANSASGASS